MSFCVIKLILCLIPKHRFNIAAFDFSHWQMVDKGIFESKGPESRSKITHVKESRNRNVPSKAETNRYIDWKIAYTCTKNVDIPTSLLD